MRKILFIHGLASSGAYKTADTLRILLKPCEVIAPDVPIDPADALSLLQGLVSRERPDLVVGLSLGGFWALQLHDVPRIVINPDLHPSALLRSRLGVMRYLSPRRDGAESFVIDEDLCRRYAALEAAGEAPSGAKPAEQPSGVAHAWLGQPDHDSASLQSRADARTEVPSGARVPADAARVRGLFAENDELVDCRDEFEARFPGCAVRYPGGHLPTYPQIKQHLVPLALELMTGE